MKLKLVKAMMIGFLFWLEVGGLAVGLAQESCSGLAGAAAARDFVVPEERVLALLKSNTLSDRQEVRRIVPPSAIVRPMVALKIFAQQVVSNHPWSTAMEWAAGILERSIAESVGTSGLRDTEMLDVDAEDILVAIQNGALHLTFGTWTKIFKYGKRFQSKEAFQDALQFGVSVIQKRMESHASFPGLSQYLRYKLIKESVKRELGLEFDLISDLATFETSPGNFSVAAYATVPIGGQTEAYGFAYRKLGELNGQAGTKSQTFQWNAGGKEYSGSVRLNRVGKSSLVPSYSFKPDYKAMLRDGKMTGAILFSGNLRGFLNELVPTYEEYLESEGFRKRSDQVLPVAEAQRFIFSRIQKMEIDYMLKEGHGHSASWGLIDLTESVRVATYSLELETIYLVFPADPLDNFLTRVPVDQLGDALRARSRPTQEFLYIDTGCRVERDLCGLAKSVAAAGFTPVGSREDVTTFTFDDGDAVYEILHGIRNKRSYRAISRAIAVRDASGEKVDHGFVFPNSYRYVLRKNGGELKRAVERYSVRIHVGSAAP